MWMSAAALLLNVLAQDLPPRRYGGLGLHLDVDFQKGVARIQGREVVLEDANVILVDDVDTGPQVAGTLRIDPSVPAPDGQHPDVEGILRRSADIISFVRCDTPMPDGKGQAMFDAICARVLGKQ